MKKKIKYTSILSIGSVLICCLLVFFSCKPDDPYFTYEVMASCHDGIQNGNETGVDCGGDCAQVCPTCDDGIQNGEEEGIDCGGPDCEPCPAATPRADEYRNLGLPYFYSFESGQEQSGENLVPMHTNPDGSDYSQGVTPIYGEQDPLGSDNAVTKIIRPENGPFGGFEDFKFQTAEAPIVFSEYHKFTIQVFIPEGQDFSGSLEPMVELVLHDNVDGNFWQRWTVIPQLIDESDFGKWVTLYFDGTNAAAADTGVLLPAQTTYTNITLRFGGSNHQEEGTFYVMDFFPTTSFVAPGTPRADAYKDAGIPFFYTFEAGDETSGVELEPATTNPDGSPYSQGVTISYGQPDPVGGPDGVAKVIRPQNGPFGGFEDFKFQFWEEKIDFSVYHKFKLDVYVPSENDFDNTNLLPLIELVLHDNVDGNFWQRWTVIPVTISEDMFDKWITIEFDGTEAGAADTGVLLPAQTTYDNFTLRLGGSGHTDQGLFYIKDFIPIE